MKCRLASLAIALPILGCSTPPPSPQELAAAEYGPYPAQYQAKIATYLQTTLKDPESARISTPFAPKKTFAGLNKPVYGWGTCMGVNAKNSFGGYTGTKIYFFLFRDGEISVVERAEDANSFATEYVNNLCKRLI
jgi:hypothetical protein